MFPQRSHLLAPLTDQVGKKKLNWTSECQKAFETIKALLARDAFIKYPNHNEHFSVYCDASDLHIILANLTVHKIIILSAKKNFYR